MKKKAAPSNPPKVFSPETESPPRPSQKESTFPKPERVFVTADETWIRMASDELGEEMSISVSKVPNLVSVSLIGMAEKEPAILLQFENTPDIELAFNSRTSAKTALGQLLSVVTQLKTRPKETAVCERAA